MLIESLRANGDDSPVYILALDDETEVYLRENALPGVFVVSIDEIESDEPRLVALKTLRSKMEYYFTCTPLIIRYVMNQLAIPDSLAIYLDSDLFFFDNPSRVVEAMDGASVGIIEHRYLESTSQKLDKYGRFNVGWVGFRNDAKGRDVLNWYADQTLEWCSDKPERGKYADQGYLNWFPEFPGVRILNSAGFNLAPWNTRRHILTLSKEPTVAVRADGDPLVFFHFHGLREFRSWFTSSQLLYRSPMTRVLKEFVYRPYAIALSSKNAEMRNTASFQGSIRKRGSGLRGFISRQRSLITNVLSVVSGNAVKAEKSSPTTEL